jgi:hypothetical protein
MLAALQALLTPITWKMETIPFLKGRADGSPRIPAAPPASLKSTVLRIAAYSSQEFMARSQQG